MLSGEWRCSADAAEMQQSSELHENAQIAMAAMHGAKLATCEHWRCISHWSALNAARRSHAKYCSDRCRVAAMRARNKGGADVNS